MTKYICTICGYAFESKNGEWENLPSNWLCPVCSASKDDFEKSGAARAAINEDDHNHNFSDLKELTPLEASALCSNLARGMEKQYKLEAAALFTNLANYYKSKMPKPENPSFESLSELVNSDIDEKIVLAKDAAQSSGDRGAMRALVWSDKVTRMLKSLLARYKKDGDKMLKDTSVYVCTICGFIYIGANLPEVCPVCKVPSWKFDMVGGM